MPFKTFLCEKCWCSFFYRLLPPIVGAIAAKRKPKSSLGRIVFFYNWWWWDTKRSTLIQNLDFKCFKAYSSFNHLKVFFSLLFNWILLNKYCLFVTLKFVVMIWIFVVSRTIVPKFWRWCCSYLDKIIHFYFWWYILHLPFRYWGTFSLLLYVKF